MIIRLDKDTPLANIENIIENIDKNEEESIISETIFGKPPAEESEKLEDLKIEDTPVEDKTSEEENNCISVIEDTTEEDIIEEDITEEVEIIEIIEDKVFYTQEEAIENLQNYLAYIQIKSEECDNEPEKKIYLVKCLIKEEINILKKETEAKNKFDAIANEIGVVADLKYNINEDIGFFTQNSNFMQDILNRFKKQTSKSRTCDNCNSVLNKDYIKTTFCPLCESKTFLTTKTDIDRAKTMKKKILNFQKEIQTIVKKRETKSDLEKWEYLTII